MVIICVPRFGWMLARTLVAAYGRRDTTYSTAYRDGGYVTPNDGQMDDIKASIAEFLEADDMCKELSEGLEAIAAAIAA